MRELIWVLICLFAMHSNADGSPESKEDEQFSLEFLQQLEKEKPELFRAGQLLSRKLVLAEWVDDSRGKIRYTYEYQYSDGWLLAKTYFPKMNLRPEIPAYEVLKTSKSVKEYNFAFEGDETLETKNNGEYFVKRYEDGETRSAWVREKKETEAGVFRVVGIEYSDQSGFSSPRTLLLDNKVIFEGSQGYLHINNIYFLDGKIYLLIGENCGGSGCRFDDLSFLELNGYDKAKVITHRDFHSENNKINPVQEDGKITVDLGLDKKQIKKAVLAEGALTITAEPAPYVPMTEDSCAYTYDTYAHECPRRHMPCSEKYKNYKNNDAAFSNAGMWNLRHARNQPGFNLEGFYAECLKACESGTAIDFKTFYNAACKLDQ